MQRIETHSVPCVLCVLRAFAVPAYSGIYSGTFFLSALSEDAEAPNAVVYLAFAGAAVLVVGLVTLGVGLLRRGSVRRGA